MKRAAVVAALGGAVGLAWSLSLRAWMAHLAIQFGDRPTYTWQGTFVSVLAPAVFVGMLIGVDWQRRREGRSRVPLVVWSPLLLLVGPAIIADDFIGTLLDTGEGSGAISVVLIGMAGGFSVSGRGPVWLRAVTGLLAAGVTGAMIVIFYIAAEGVGPSTTFGSVHLAVLLAWLAVCCSVPMRDAKTMEPSGVMGGRLVRRPSR